MGKERSGWDTATNVLVIFATLATVAYVGWRFNSERSVAASDRIAALQPGEKFPLGSLKFNESELTVVLIISSRCPTCVASAAFYKRLVDGKPPRVGVVAIGGEPGGTLSAFLGEHEIRVDQVVSASPAATRVSTVPTLVLVNSAGNVVRLWRGFLPESIQKEVVDELTSR